MSLSHRNGPGPFGRGSWWEGFRCRSGPGLVRVFVPGGVGRLRHGRAGGGAGLRSAPRARAPGSALPAPGEDPPFDAVRDPDGGACGVRIRSGWTLDEENRHRSRAPHALPLCPVGAFKSTIRGRVGQRPGARPRARPAVARTSGVPSVPCSRARRRRSGGAGAHRRSVPCPRARRLRQRTRKHQPPRPPSRPPSPRRAHTTARSPARATTRYSSRPPDRGPAPVRRTRGGHVTARRATTIQATTAERGTATQDIPPAGTGREPHYQSRPSRGRLPARSVRPILPTAGVRPGRAPMLDTGRGARRH